MARHRRAWAVNATASATVARWCADQGARTTVVSSDFVFPGRSGGSCGEEAPVGPVTAYGGSKVAAEEAVLASADGLVLRSLGVTWVRELGPWVLGPARSLA